MAAVLETFVTVHVADMQRATRFYTAALQASVSRALPWLSVSDLDAVRAGVFVADCVGSEGSYK